MHLQGLEGSSRPMAVAIYDDVQVRCELLKSHYDQCLKICMSGGNKSKVHFFFQSILKTSVGLVQVTGVVATETKFSLGSHAEG